MGNHSWPDLTPTPGLGSYSRTAASMLCAAPRSRIGNQVRVYNWYAKRGQGEAYKLRLLKSLGPIPTYTYKTRQLFNY